MDPEQAKPNPRRTLEALQARWQREYAPAGEAAGAEQPDAAPCDHGAQPGPSVHDHPSASGQALHPQQQQQQQQQLPAGWHAVWDPRYSTYYYCHPAAGLTQWEPPTQAPLVPDAPLNVHTATGTASSESHPTPAEGSGVLPAAQPVHSPAPAVADAVAAAAVAPLATAYQPSGAVASGPAATATPSSPNASRSADKYQQQQQHVKLLQLLKAVPPEARVWQYSDPKGSTCGPFTLQQLRSWRSGLPMNLRVWHMGPLQGLGDKGPAGHGQGPNPPAVAGVEVQPPMSREQEEKAAGGFGTGRGIPGSGDAAATTEVAVAAATTVPGTEGASHHHEAGSSSPQQQQHQQQQQAQQVGKSTGTGAVVQAATPPGVPRPETPDPASVVLNPAGVRPEGLKPVVCLAELLGDEALLQSWQQQQQGGKEDAQQQQQQQQGGKEDVQQQQQAADVKEELAADAGDADGGGAAAGDDPPVASAAAAGGGGEEGDGGDGGVGGGGVGSASKGTAAAGGPARTASPLAPPAPVWAAWCAYYQQQHQQQQQQELPYQQQQQQEQLPPNQQQQQGLVGQWGYTSPAAAAALAVAAARGRGSSSMASYAAAVLVGLPPDDAAVQLAAAAVRHGQPLESVLQGTWALGGTGAVQGASSSKVTYVKDPRSGRLKAVAADDAEGEVGLARELYGDMASWCDPLQLEASLKAAARAKKRQQQQHGAAGASFGTGGGGSAGDVAGVKGSGASSSSSKRPRRVVV